MNVLDPKLYAKHVDIETEWNLKEIIITFKQKASAVDIPDTFKQKASAVDIETEWNLKAGRVQAVFESRV